MSTDEPEPNASTAPAAAEGDHPGDARPATDVAPSRRRSTAWLAAVVVVVWTFGFVVGLFVGLRHRFQQLSAPARPTPTSLPGPTAALGPPSSTAAPEPPLQPAAFALDLGSDEAAERLRGDWSPAESFDDGRVVAAVTGAAEAAIALPAVGGDGRLELWAVAKAVGGPREAASAVALSIGGRPLTTWQLGSGWTLLRAPWAPELGRDADGGTAGEVLVELRLQPPPDGAAEAAEPLRLAIDFLELSAPSATARIQLAAPRGQSRLVEGFWPVEAADDGTRFAWSRGRRSAVVVPLAPADVDYRLALRAGAIEYIAPVRVTVEVNDREVGKLDVAADDADHVVAVPRSALRTGANRVELLYAETARPVDHGGGEDTRQLAIALSGFALEPARD